MAVVHPDAELTPSKPEIVSAWLVTQPWAAGLRTGDEPPRIGSYRFDDPDGEVGIEALLFAVGDQVLHLPVTYRGAPLEGAEEFLLGTMEHSVLGTRWVYDACADPVAVRAWVTAVVTGGEQATFEVERDGVIVERRTPTVRAVGSGSAATGPDLAPVSVAQHDATTVVEAGGLRLTVARLLPAEMPGRETLTVVWEGGRAVVAAVS